MRDTPTIGFIGLGNMGMPMVTNLVDAGFSVRGYDVSKDAVARLEGVGAQGQPSADAAADGADFVILMLPNSAIVTSVVDDLLSHSALRPGTIIIDMSSSEPLSTRELAGKLQAVGVQLVDAPVSGGVTGAIKGTLTVMVGGVADAVEKAIPVLSAVGKPVRCGAVGAGHAVKALNNLLSAVHLWATSEAMEAGVAFGLDPDVMLSIFNTSSGRSGSTENKWPNFVIPGGYDSGFGLALMLKDMKIAVGLSESNGSPREIGAKAVELWSEAADHLPATADHTEVARWVASRSERHGGTTAAPAPWEG